MSQFKDSRIKLQRAEKHLAEFEKLMADFLISNPVRWQGPSIDSKSAPEKHLITWKVSTDPLSEESGAIFGDVVHNLRTALDLMACELARRNGQSDKSVYFPFCEEAIYLDTMIKEKNFHRAGPKAVTLLKKFAPHKGGNVALRAIHDLDMQDKHRSIVPSLISTISPEIRIGHPIPLEATQKPS